MLKRTVWLKKIHDELGGWNGIFERRASGMLWKDIAALVGCSVSFLAHMRRHAGKKSEKFIEAAKLAETEYAERLAEQSLEIVDADLDTREAIDRAKLRAGHRRWLASVYDREKFGEPKDKMPNAPISIGELHIQALIQAPPKQNIQSGTKYAQLPSGPSVADADVQSAAPVTEEPLDG